MLSMNKTFDQICYEDTATEIITSMAKDLSRERASNSTFSAQYGIDKSVSEIEFHPGLKDLYTKYHAPGNPRVESPASLMKNNMDVIKIGDFDMSIKKCIDMALDIKKYSPELFYGVLLSCQPNRMPGGKRVTFNPLHPIIASELSQENPPIDLDDEIWTMSVFAWNEESWQAVNEFEQMGHMFNDHNFVPEIATTLSTLLNGSKYVIKNSKIRAEIERNKFVITFEEKRYKADTDEEIKADGSNHRNWIVPLQILNNGGVAYPYYGAVYTKNGLAWNLSPMMSANISRPSEGASTLSYGSRICTKSGDSKTMIGVSALNHCNLTSPLNSRCFSTGSFTYAHQCVMASLEILTGERLVDVEVKTKPMTLKEFLDEDESRTTKEYLEYMKNFVSSAEVAPESEMNEQSSEGTDIMNTTEPIDLNDL